MNPDAYPNGGRSFRTPRRRRRRGLVVVSVLSLLCALYLTYRMFAATGTEKRLAWFFGPVAWFAFGMYCYLTRQWSRRP